MFDDIRFPKIAKKWPLCKIKFGLFLNAPNFVQHPFWRYYLLLHTTAFYSILLCIFFKLGLLKKQTKINKWIILSIHTKSWRVNILSNVNNEWYMTYFVFDWECNTDTNKMKWWSGGIIFWWKVKDCMWKISLDYKPDSEYLLGCDSNVR